MPAWLFSGNREGGAAAGPPDPFTAAVLGELPRLRRYAIALVRDVSQAEDLLQDCVERALRNRKALDDPERMSGWLRSILRNLHRDDLRRQRRRGATVEWEDSENLIALSAPPEDRGTARDVVRAMNALSVEHREILLLVALEERSYREIADELDIPIGTVMSRLARARAQLRHRLEEEDSPDAPVASGRNAGKAATGR